MGLVAVAALVTAMAALSTSRADVSATTENRSNLFTSGSIDVEAGSREALLFDHDELYPGLVVEACFQVHYRGSIEGSDVRLFGEQMEDSVLDELIEVAVWTGDGAVDGPCHDFIPDGNPVFRGSMGELWSTHPSHDQGLDLLPDAETGDEVSVRLRARLVSDERADQAQGARSDFVVVVEARL
ncbi:MAG: hypothetical protein OES57_16360 [Acidimicrobiia bacterium]|nr:hypothetical protein [Acidimicrobiia bacterium]